MLRRRAVLLASALAAGLAVSASPAVADDGAGSGPGWISGWTDESDGSDDSSGTDDTGDGSSDGTDDSSLTSTGGGSGGDGCGDSLTLELAGLGGGNCGLVPEAGDQDPAAVVPVVDARGEAEQAFERMPLVTADVRMAPGPPLPTYPNLETWIWVPRSQWDTLSLEVNAGATTVHVEARPVRIDIDSGERDQMKYASATIDSTFSCSGPGQVWDESLGDDAETSCGYEYQTTSSNNPDGGDDYRLTATIVYEGYWTCVGQCTEDGGSLGEVNGPTGTQPVVVQERQSVVVD